MDAKVSDPTTATRTERGSSPAQNPWLSFVDGGQSGAALTDALTKLWSAMPDAAAGQALDEGIRSLNEMFAGEQVLQSIDQMWNANPLRGVVPVDWAGIAGALRTVWMRSMRNPRTATAAALELNARLFSAAADVWNDAARRWLGLQTAASSSPDKRFAAAEWQSNPAFRMLKETYLVASDWLLHQADATDIDDTEKQRINFHLRQFIDATSPTLLLLTNPDALRRAVETGGASVVEGARNLLSDMNEGRLSMVDATAFAPGRNLALTPGKVVHRNKLIELIQYTPSTETVHPIPLLILPPWINKYYILDMQPKNSLVRFLVEQGFTVFVVSWKNPDGSMDATSFEDYMDLGILEASDVIRDITGSVTVNVMGYCIGGTLLAMTLAWLAAKNDNRFGSATFMVSLQDFSNVGDTAIFLGESAIDFVEQQMLERGYLDSREMSNMFNLLRSNDLIWSNVVNNYLLGQKPPAFDLLYWNSDGTRMARAAHSWYLRNTYVENNLIKPGKIVLQGEALDLGRITLDTYAVGAEKDHIVPWKAAWRITQLISGKVRFILGSSGHIAGIINPPGGKGSYWVNDKNDQFESPERWQAESPVRNGSWWTDWAQWLGQRAGERVKPPGTGNASHPPLCDAPGTYVLEK